MGHLCHFRIFALSALASLISCSNASMMDATDDEMAGPMSPAQVDAACSACLERDCAWEATECAADPRCATWLTCVKAEGVHGDCSDPGGLTAQGLQSATASCLSNCCADNAGPTYQTPGASGSGGGSNTGAAGSDSELTREDGGIEADGWQCPETPCSCEDCITGVAFYDQGNSCTSAFAQCKEPKCSLVLEAYYKCQTQPATGATAGQRELESCLFLEFREKVADPDYLVGIKEFMQWRMPCMANQCVTHCVPSDAQACLACQEKSCGDEMKIFRSDSHAILNIWCRSYCQLNPQDGCPSMCSQYLLTDANATTPNQETLDALKAYGECALRCPEC